MKDNQDSILKQFNLPSYVKGKTFAEASKAINERFKGQEDSDSQATLKELQERLQAAQEFVKAQSEPKQPSISSNPELPAGSESMNSEQNVSQGGEQAAGMQDPAANIMGAMNANGEGVPNQYFLGGLLGGNEDKVVGAEGAEAGGGPGVGGYAQAASGAMELGKMAFGDTGIDTSGASAAPQVQSKGGAALGGAAKGAQAGMSFGPWGAAVGGVIGGVAGLVGRGKAAEEANTAAINYTSAQDKKFNNTYEDGGKLKYSSSQLSDIFDPINNNAPGAAVAKVATQRQGLNLNTAGTFNEQIAANKAASNKVTSTPGNINSGTESNAGAKFNPGALLRYAPAAANAYQIATLKKPAQEGYDRLGNVYDRQLVDEKGLQNTVAQDVAGMRDRLVATSGGSGSTARANLLASQLQGTKALSDAYMKSEDVNRGENRAAQEFKLNVDRTNLGQSNIQTQANAQNQGAYDSQKSALIAQLGNDLGGIGQEELFKQYPELMGMDYNTRGEYLAKLKAEKERKDAARKLARMAK